MQKSGINVLGIYDFGDETDLRLTFYWLIRNVNAVTKSMSEMFPSIDGGIKYSLHLY